jgi:hypothetical protein
MLISGYMVGRLFREQEGPKRALLPAITRTVHNSIVSLGRTARNMRISSEGTYRRPHRADVALRIAANVDTLGLQANPLPRRFEKLLETI